MIGATEHMKSYSRLSPAVSALAYGHHGPVGALLPHRKTLSNGLICQTIYPTVYGTSDVLV